MNIVPVLISIGIATTISAYMLNHQQDAARMSGQATIDSFENAVKNLSPLFGDTQCVQLNNDFMASLPEGSNWEADIHKNACDTAELSITLPAGHEPGKFFPPKANAHITGQTFSWSLNMLDTRFLQIPHHRLQAAKESSRSCNRYSCAGDPNSLPMPTIFSNSRAFAAIKADGTVVTWGNSNFGGSSASVASDLVNVIDIEATGNTGYGKGAFAALKEDGSVVTWGDGSYGGDSSSVSGALNNIIDIYATEGAFAAVSKTNTIKTVTTWGDCNYGKVWGFFSSNHSGSGNYITDKIDTIYASQRAFAALLNNDKVITWGGGCTMQSAGNSSQVASQLVNIKAIYPAPYSFCAIGDLGKVTCWGQSLDGYHSLASNQLAANVETLVTTKQYGAYAALKSDGSVVTWGNSNYGGDSSNVSSALSSGVDRIFANGMAFAAHKPSASGGSIIVLWGHRAFGGRAYNHTVSGSLSPIDANHGFIKEFDEKIVDIAATHYAFAALSDQGNVATWGYRTYGGNSATVSERLTNIQKIVGSKGAFAAITDTGAVITWGHNNHGGNSSEVSNSLTSDVVDIYANEDAFAAVKADGEIVTWGHPTNGGDSSGVDFN